MTRTLKVLARNRLVVAAVSALLCTILVLTLFPPSVEGKKAPSEGNLREAVSQTLSSNVAVVDEATPLSSIRGRDILFVDGSFYAGSNPSVSEQVQGEALAGTTVVFIGSGFKDFCTSLHIGFEEVHRRDGVEISIAANALRILPQRTSEGDRVTAILSLGGNCNDPTPGLIQRLIEWHEEFDSPHDLGIGTVSQPEVVTMSGGSHWEPVHYRQYDTYRGDEPGQGWAPYGIMNVSLTTMKLMDDYMPNDDFYYMAISKEMSPGEDLWDSGWRNDESWIHIDINEDYPWTPWQTMIDYGPTTTVGSQTATVTVGASIPGGVGASVSWSYELPDVIVLVSGSMVTTLMWHHDINHDSWAGDHDYEMLPGFSWRTEQDAWSVYANPWFQCQWKKNWWWWHKTWKSVDLGLPVVIWDW